MRNVSLQSSIPPMGQTSIGVVRAVEAYLRTQKQVKLPVEHFLHGGMYGRTVLIPAGVIITGALIKIPTVLIVNGDCLVYRAPHAKSYKGYHVLTAAAHRKQVFVARADTNLTMLFPTDAETVKDAEEQFTDEVNLLQSHEA